MSQNLLKWSLQGFSVLRHPNHLLLTDVNNRNVIIDQLFHAASDQSNRDFFWYTACIFQLSVLFYVYARATIGCLLGEIPDGGGGGGGNNIRQISNFFFKECLQTLVHAFVTSR